MTLKALMDGCDISLPQYSHPKLTEKLDHPVDEPIVEAASQVALVAKNEVAATVQAKMARAEPDHPPRARTA